MSAAVDLCRDRGRHRRPRERRLRSHRRHLRQPRSAAGRPVRRHAGHGSRRAQVRRRSLRGGRGRSNRLAACRRPARAGRRHGESARGPRPRIARAVEARIVGVTGSVGKTSTKEALYAALDRVSGGKAHRSVKSYNNHTGVPLSLARMPREAEFAVLEMGMNNTGEIAALTRMVRPHLALDHRHRSGAHREPRLRRGDRRRQGRNLRRAWSRAASRSCPTTRRTATGWSARRGAMPTRS